MRTCEAKRNDRETHERPSALSEQKEKERERENGRAKVGDEDGTEDGQTTSGVGIPGALSRFDYATCNQWDQLVRLSSIHFNRLRARQTGNGFAVAALIDRCNKPASKTDSETDRQEGRKAGRRE